MSTQIPEDKKVLVRTIIKKALLDESYKSKLLKNPMDAIKEVYPDFFVNGNKEIVVTDQTDSTKYYFNISHISHALYGGDAEEIPLTEEELEMVAGGGSCVNFSCIFTQE